MIYGETAYNCFTLTIPVVMVGAGRFAGTDHANPFRPELQVKLMIARLSGREKRINPVSAKPVNTTRS